MRALIAGSACGAAVVVAGCSLLGGFDFGAYSAIADAGAPVDATVVVDAAAAPDSPPEAARDPSVDGAADAVGEAASDGGGPDGASDGASEDGADAAREGGPDSADAAQDGAGVGIDGAPDGGREGHLDAGDAAEAGAPVVLAAAVSPGGLAVNDSTVYWVDGNDVSAVSVDGGATSTFFAGSSRLGGSLALDRTNLYWTVGTYAQTSFLAGGGGFFFDSFSSEVDVLGQLAVDRQNLYLARTFIDPQGGGCATIQIDVAPLVGGGAATAWQGSACNVQHMVADGTNLYWTDVGTSNSFAHPAVWQQAVDGGAAVPVAEAQYPNGLAEVAGTLVWSDTNAGQIWRAPIGGTAAPVLLARSPSPGDLVADDSTIYWIDGQSSVLAAALDGGAPRTLATGQVGAEAIAVNTSSVFWIDRGSGEPDGGGAAVMKIAK